MSTEKVHLNRAAVRSPRPAPIAPRIRTITLTLEPCAAAALHRLCEKLGHSDAMAFLYPHISREIRSSQAYDMVCACGIVHTALEEAGVRSWPWIEGVRS